MPNDEFKPVVIKRVSDLGPGNRGGIGPSSKTERQAHKDVGQERYWGPRLDKSACMDDRLEGLRLHLAGNRAITEVAGNCSNSEIGARPLSQEMAEKVRELVTMGRVPVFHRGCAALAAVREVLAYNAQNEDAVADALWRTLSELGVTKFVSQSDIRESIKAGKTRSLDGAIWDCAPEELMSIAAENGAEIEDTPGQHRAAGNLDNMSGLGFNNGLFRGEHAADDGQPMGLLTIDWAGYRDQLRQDGFSESETAIQLMLSGLFIIGTQKLIGKDGSPLVVAGHPV